MKNDSTNVDANAFSQINWSFKSSGIITVVRSSSQANSPQLISLTLNGIKNILNWNRYDWTLDNDLNFWIRCKNSCNLAHLKFEIKPIKMCQYPFQQELERHHHLLLQKNTQFPVIIDKSLSNNLYDINCKNE